MNEPCAPSRRCPSVWRVAATLLLGSIAVIAIANWWVGLEGWDARNGLQSAVDLSLLGISLLALANLLAQQMTPGSRYRAAVWVWLTAPVVALLAAVALLYGDVWKPDYVAWAMNCLKIGGACAAVSTRYVLACFAQGLFPASDRPRRYGRGFSPGLSASRCSRFIALIWTGSTFSSRISASRS